jgi:hypothetical protein
MVSAFVALTVWSSAAMAAPGHLALPPSGVMQATTGQATTGQRARAGSSFDPILHLAHDIDGRKHMQCRRGPGGWHYHLEKRLMCRARPASRYWAWRKRPDGRWGWWHRRQRWWLTPLPAASLKKATSPKLESGK